MRHSPELPLPKFSVNQPCNRAKKRPILTARFLQIALVFVFTCLGSVAQAQLPPTLTPPPAASPRITGAQVFGARPGNPFIFLITATGDRPMTFSATGLPAGLSVDSSSGLITGSVAQRGTYDATVSAQNASGTASRPLRIVIGSQIGLTPAMGWNPFNSYGTSFSDAIVRQNASAIVSSGLINYGYQYVNLDEGWEGPRNISAPYSDTNPGPLTGNNKFPDMPGLASYIHGLNLKFGVYSIPRPLGYSGFTGGSYITQTTNETLLASPQDIQQFVDWGVDYLKFDGDNEASIDFQTTSASVRSASRDIVYSLSQSTGAQITDAPILPNISNSWRASYDANDEWSSVLNDGFLAVTYGNGGTKPSPNDWAPYTGPGRFADLDMLTEGFVAFGGSTTRTQSRLSPDEQYTHLSQWSLIASPLLIGGELTLLDQFTTGLYSNADVLDVDQDPLGIQATRKSSTGDSGVQVWSRPLADGSVAVGLFNLSGAPATVTANWSDLGITGSQSVRDLWRQQDLGTFNGQFGGVVNTHGVLFVKLTPTASNRPRITAQPVNAEAQEGQTATFSVAATGSGLTYQWTKNGNAIPGANSSTYTTPSTSYADDGSYYRCIVNDGSNTGKVNSYETLLKVYGSSSTDLALNRPVTTSGSVFSGFPATNAVDGNNNTDWWGLHIDPSWLYVDLGANYTINEINIATDVTSSFNLQVAPEGSNALNTDVPWTTVGSRSGITTYGATTDLTGLAAFGRYVRFQSTSRFAFGQFNLPTVHELKVYGTRDGGQSTPIATSTSLSINPNTSTLTAGQSFTLQATVTPASGSTTPTGSVVFSIGSTTSTVPLSGSGSASYSGSFPAAGSYMISATYQGSSAFSSSNSSTITETVTGGATAPGAPASLSATVGDGQVSLTWTAASNAATYNVYLGTTTGGEGATAVQTGLTSTSTTVTGLTNGTTYFFTVKAVNPAGTSAASNEASATPASAGGGGGGGTLLAYEPFNVPAGALDSVSDGSGWAGAWVEQSGSTDVPGYNVATGSALTSGSLTTLGNHAVGGFAYQTAGRALDVSSGGAFSNFAQNGLVGAPGTTVWVSALLRKDTASGDPLWISLHPSDIPWATGSSNVSLGSQGGSGTQLWSLTVNGTVYPTTTQVVVGQTVELVASITFGPTNTVHLYVNPTSGSNPPASADVTGTSTSSIAFRSVAFQAGYGPGSGSLDEIRLGTSFASVTPTN